MNEFYKARGFNALVAKGTAFQMNATLWFPVFADEQDAVSFARYVGGFARRVVNGSTTRATAKWSDKRSGYIAVLSVQFPGWGREEGPVICQSTEVAGIGIGDAKSPVLLPIKQHRYTARTESGSLYIGFADGTAFCRSKTSGPQSQAAALYFTSSFTDASKVQERGGEIAVSEQPKVGLYPVYVTGAKPTPSAGGCLTFASNTFRLGTKVVIITAA